MLRAIDLRERTSMISVVIPTWNAEATLAATLERRPKADVVEIGR